MTDSPGDRRRFQRIEFDAATELVQGDRRWPVELHDLSLKACWFAARKAGMPMLNIRSKRGCAWPMIAEVRMEVAMTHEEGDLIGFVCQHIDLDSIAHLRRLVELNLGDEALLERELAALGGQ